MIHQEKETKTGQAWDKLYGRLDNEGLIPEASHTVSGRKSGVTLRWTAVAAAACLLCLFLVYRYTGKESLLIRFSNNPGNPTWVITLEDCSTVWLEENATLAYPEKFGRAKREINLDGNAFFEISPDKARPFVIHTGQATIEVVGTAFHVRSGRGNDFSLTVREGEVRVSENPENVPERTNESLCIYAGETLRIDENGMEKFRTTESDLFYTFKERVFFKDQPLEYIIRFINQNPDSIRVVLDPGIESRIITASFSGENAEQMVELLCAGLGFTHFRNGNTITISPTD